MSARDDTGIPQPGTRLGYLWAGLALVTCPCHLPILLVVLSGTALGAVLSEHLGAGLLAGAVLFFVFLAAAMRSLKRGSESPR